MDDSKEIRCKDIMETYGVSRETARIRIVAVKEAFGIKGRKPTFGEYKKHFGL